MGCINTYSTTTTVGHGLQANPQIRCGILFVSFLALSHRRRYHGDVVQFYTQLVSKLQKDLQEICIVYQTYTLLALELELDRKTSHPHVHCMLPRSEHAHLNYVAGNYDFGDKMLTA